MVVQLAMIMDGAACCDVARMLAQISDLFSMHRFRLLLV
jgi:hypothetical protein